MFTHAGVWWCVWGGGGECTYINICTSIFMTVHISECTALMSPNRAKQPYMHEKWILIDLELLPTLGFSIAHYRVLLANATV